MKKKEIIALTVASLIAVATGAYLAQRTRKRAGRNTPPKNAPQLSIKNPGDQSEFPSAPEGERDLG